MDSKNLQILRELDINYRESLSKIAKKVKLSKNSVALRFNKLKKSTLHNTTGINTELLGQKLVKVYYSLNYYDEKIEEELKELVKKEQTVRWVARLYGTYDLCIAYLIQSTNDLEKINEFNKKLSTRTIEKEIQIINKQIYFRHNFLHKIKIEKISVVKNENKIEKLSENEKLILKHLRYNPRMQIIEIAKQTKLSSKTVLERIKSLKKRKIIMGFFMTLNVEKMGFQSFKILMQVGNSDRKKLEKYLTGKNTRYISQSLGKWEYEIDYVFKSSKELHAEIDRLKNKFPGNIKITLINFGKRIITNELFN